ncbi:MAG TPA: pseudouridine synthase [Chloroflexota bacterium]|nr:pseudouridine synthase [Chloroflexota bacterium]
MDERLQKVLAEAGVASRRAAERLIAEGRVAVNGVVVRTLGARVDPGRDVVTVDGRRVTVPSQKVYYVVHKPAGVVSTARDERGRPTVLDLVPADRRLFPVGRLDADSEGLLLLTDDGALAYRLTHPRYGVEKEYHVLVRGRPTPAALERLRTGIELEEGRTAPAQVGVLRRAGGHTWLRIVLRQGWKRQIRRMLAAVGYPVERLVRVRIGGLELDDLPPGAARRLTAAEAARALEGVDGPEAVEQDGSQGHRHRRPSGRR